MGTSNVDHVEIDGLTVNYGSALAIADVSFSIGKGEMVALLGPSGCGKSTILRSVAGLLAAGGGRISIDGQLVTDPRNGISIPPERRNLGMVFQSYAIWPHMSVGENVGYPLRVRGIKGEEAAKLVRDALALVGLPQMEDRSATELSGGQQQRVAIARALVFGPRLLLLDEPLSNLDTKLRDRMGLELKAIQERAGVTSLYVTHDQNEALSLADRIVILKEGVIQQSGPPEEVYSNPANAFVSWFVGRTNFLDGVVVSLGDLVSVRIGQGGIVHCRADRRNPVAVDQKVVVSIRPEDIEIQGSAEDNISGVVVSNTFHGDRRHIIVDVSGERIMCYIPRGKNVQIGEPVGLLTAPGSAMVFNERYKF